MFHNVILPFETIYFCAKLIMKEKAACGILLIEVFYW